MDGARRGIRRLGGRPLGDIAAIAWLVVIAVGFLGPALSHGSALGPYDILHLFGLGHQANAQVHNAVDSDEIQEFIPWQVLAWRQVHAGQLPLWDPYNLLGMPYGLNFESAPFGLTTAIGYAFPLALAHTATVTSRLVLSGTGVYVLCRTLRLGPLPGVMAATVFELSGAFTVWMGTYESGVYCFMGWILAASVVLMRGRRRAVPGVLLAIVLAVAFAAGEPQVDALVVVFLAVFVGVVAWVRARRARVAGARASGAGGAATAGAGAGSGAGTSEGHLMWRVVLDHVLALVAACALVAPIYLPSLQLLSSAARTSGPYVSALKPEELTHLLFASYNGVPTTLASYIGPNDSYVSMVYVGAIGLVLALCALAWWRRRAETVALSVLAAGLLIALFFPPVVTLLRHIPEVKVFRLDLATPLLDLALALLAGFGAASLVTGRGGAARVVRSGRLGAVERLFVVGTALVSLAILALGVRLATSGSSLSAAEAHVRAESFLWPAISVGACEVAAGGFVVARQSAQRIRGRHARADLGGNKGARARRLRLGALVLLVGVETAFLFVSGAWTPSSSSQPLATPPPVAALARATHGELTAAGSCVENAFPDVGVMPDANVLYGISELTDYDPMISNAYYAAYGTVARTTKKALVPHVFCPAVTSTRLARFFGVSYVVEPTGTAGPAGTRKVGVIDGETLYFVPGSGRATLVPLGLAQGRSAAKVAGGTGQRVQHASEPSPTTWRVDVVAARASLLIVRVTAVPGWHATIDGKPLALRSYGGILLAADVPSGEHTVVLTYAPPLIDEGLAAFGVAAVALVCVLVVAGRTRRRNGRPRARVRDAVGLPPVAAERP